MTTAEIIQKAEIALAYLEDGARETGLIRLADIVRENQAEVDEIERLGASGHRRAAS